MVDTKIAAIFDCNIYLQALINDESVAAKCFELAHLGEINLFISSETFDELKEVLSRPAILKLIPGATVTLIKAFLDEVQAIAVNVRRCPVRFRLARDPDDEPYLNLAIAAKADFIVTRDKDLLDLMTDYTEDAKEFRQRFRSIRIVKPPQFLAAIKDSKT